MHRNRLQFVLPNSRKYPKSKSSSLMINLYSYYYYQIIVVLNMVTRMTIIINDRDHSSLWVTRRKERKMTWERLSAAVAEFSYEAKLSYNTWIYSKYCNDHRSFVSWIWLNMDVLDWLTRLGAIESTTFADCDAQKELSCSFDIITWFGWG
jgi:hypothetical protein